MHRSTERLTSTNEGIFRPYDDPAPGERRPQPKAELRRLLPDGGFGSDSLLSCTVERMSASSDLEEVVSAVQEAALLVGFTVYACEMISGAKAGTEKALHFASWHNQQAAGQDMATLLSADPARLTAVILDRPVTWGEQRKSFPVTSATRRFYAEAAERGLFEGLVTPVRTQEGCLAVVTMAGARRSLGEAEKQFLSRVSVTALDQAEAMSGATGAHKVRLSLSPRELECLKLVLRGFNDREIARLLGVSEATPKFHLDNAKRKLGARSRPHLVALAGLAELSA